MDLNTPTSLRFYSSVKIASILFCRQDLMYLKQKQQHLVGWVGVQDSVAQLVRCLQLPKNVEESLQELILPIGDQIRRWLSKRALAVKRKVDLYNKFSWTSHGMIDYKKTAENLIECGQLDSPAKFTLACLDAVDEYGLYITQDSERSKSISIPLCKFDMKTEHECSIMFLHLMELTPKDCFAFNPLESPLYYETKVKESVSKGNTSMTRYFIANIDPDKKAALVRSLVLDILKSNNRFLNLGTLLFLLSQMDVQQMDDLFVENAEIVLLRFLEWPLQRHFTKLANRLWGSISPASFSSILQAIAQHIIQHCSISTNPFGYRDIFRDFWCGSPSEYRRVCMNDLIFPILNSVFRSHGYVDSILRLFKEKNCKEKLETLFFSEADAVLEILSNENKAKAFESIIQRYFPPTDIQVGFEEEYALLTQKYLESYYGEIDMAD